MRVLAITLFVYFCCFSVNAQTSISGDWEGAINIQGQQLKVVFHVEGEPKNYSGTLDIPQQGAMGLNLTRVEQKADSVFVTFFAGQGNGEFEGILESDSLITGTYRQGVASFPFEVRKQISLEEPEKIIGEGKELIIPAGEVQIGGTLVTSENAENTPLVILISGSGAQDRNSDVFGFKIFAEMAEHFKQQGISSFRYDDRQIGKSTGSFSDATLDLLVSDVNAIIDYLNDLEDESFSQIILIGHSQGGVVAGKVADENQEVDQLILMASTGVDLKEILRFQVTQAYGEGIHPEERIEKEIALRENLMKAIQSGENIEEAKEEYRSFYRNEILENLSAVQKSGVGDLDVMAGSQTEQLTTVFSSPQIQSLLFYDPAEDLKELEMPVLVLFGEKDTQVTEQLNQTPIEESLIESGTEYEVKVFQEANHLFQKANSGQVAEYAMLEKEFLPGFLEYVSNWIINNSKE